MLVITRSRLNQLHTFSEAACAKCYIRSTVRSGLTTSRLFEAVIVLGVFAIAARAIGDPDFWWHLHTGQYIVTTHSVPHHDFYSHTRLGTPWIAHEWLSEAIIYILYRLAGWTGLIATFAGVISAAFWIAFRRSPGRPYLAGIVALWGAVATIPFWGVRPQIFSLLMASVFLYLLDRYERSRTADDQERRKANRLLWLMPPLIAVWVNLHGGFAVGLALIAVAVAADLIDAALVPADRARCTASAKKLASVFAVSALAVLLNPNGHRMYLYPFQTLALSSLQNFILEWASPDFHLPRMQAFAALLIGTFVLIAMSGRRPKTRDLLLSALTAYAAVQSSRHIPLFALVAIPLISASLLALTERSRRLEWLSGRTVHNRTPRFALNAMIASLLVLACAARVYRVGKAQPGFEARELPLAAVAYLRQQRPPEPLFNSYEWGGYLIWKLYPDYRVFVDGRSDLYGDAFLEQFVRTYKADDDWRQELRRFNINTVMLPPESPLAVMLRDDPAWRTAFEDRQAIVMVRRGPKFVPEDSSSIATKWPQ